MDSLVAPRQLSAERVRRTCSSSRLPLLSSLLGHSALHPFPDLGTADNSVYPCAIRFGLESTPLGDGFGGSQRELDGNPRSFPNDAFYPDGALIGLNDSFANR